MLDRINILCAELKTLTKRLKEKMRVLENQVKEIRLIIQREEKELQRDVDTLLSNYSKIESEKVLKEKEITEIRDEIDAIRNRITQVSSTTLLRIIIEILNFWRSNCKFSIYIGARNKLKSIEQRNLPIVDSIKADIGDKIKFRDKIEASLSTIEDFFFA